MDVRSQQRVFFFLVVVVLHMMFFLEYLNFLDTFTGIRRRSANRTAADLIGVCSNYSLKNSVVRVMNVTVKGSPAGESFALMARHLHNYPATRERCVHVLGVSAVIRLASFLHLCGSVSASAFVNKCVA